LEGKTSSDLELIEIKTREIKYYNWKTKREKTAPNTV
jgi:phage antirepressor YoqD-like protein